MIAAVILALSTAGLVEFFIAYCRSLISATSGHILSEQARTLAEAEGNRVAPERFAPVMRLVKLCPRRPNGSEGVGFVAAYYRLMTLVGGLAREMRFGSADWTESERAGCAFFAAVVLDRRIAHSRGLLAEQMSHTL